MIVRIGDTTVSQAAYNYVKSQNNQFSNANELYKELSSKYDSLNFFGASGQTLKFGIEKQIRNDIHPELTVVNIPIGQEFDIAKVWNIATLQAKFK